MIMVVWLLSEDGEATAAIDDFFSGEKSALPGSRRSHGEVHNNC